MIYLGVVMSRTGLSAGHCEGEMIYLGGGFVPPPVEAPSCQTAVPSACTATVLCGGH